MLPEGITVICGIQLVCQGNVAVEEVVFEEGIGIPVCEACKEYLTHNN